MMHWTSPYRDTHSWFPYTRNPPPPRPSLPYRNLSNGTRSRVGEGNEIYVAAFGGHHFYDIFPGLGGHGPSPPPDPLLNLSSPGPLDLDKFKLVHYEACTVDKWVVGILLEWLSCLQTNCQLTNINLIVSIL